MSRSSKIINVLQKAGEYIKLGRYYDTRHAMQRKAQRDVALTDVLYVLRKGYHEKKKDEFKPEHNSWNYAIRGKTIDGRDIRIVIAFDENDMLIITVIEVIGNQR
ncbi:MAG TPA: DUF4258 domain-containing protein [Rhabdochlamydiaceae bacterium]|nr:DUF4258 domain-containing protein [Rhabdochlamydiaceae bacterium]